jgi:hypothetical protein
VSKQKSRQCGQNPYSLEKYGYSVKEHHNQVWGNERLFGFRFVTQDISCPQIYQGLSEGIIATGMKGVTFKDPHQREESSPQDTVFADGKGGVG